MNLTAPRLVLASESLARRAILDQAAVPFSAQKSDLAEEPIKQAGLARDRRPADIAMDLAEAKALKVSRLDPEALVIGADQTLEFETRLMDKATSLADVRRRLHEMQGRWHTLHSALAMAREGRIVWRYKDQARLLMRSLSNDFIDAYIGREGEALLSIVGSYRLEGLGAQLFDRVEGDYFTILGLPLWPLLEQLRAEGVILR